MCFPTNTRPRRLVLASGQPRLSQIQRQETLTVMKKGSCLMDKCEPPKRQGSMVGNGCDAIQDEGMEMDLSTIMAGSSIFKCEPPTRRESMSSDYTDATSSESTSSCLTTAPSTNERKLAEFIGRSSDKRLYRLRRHNDVYDASQNL